MTGHLRFVSLLVLVLAVVMLVPFSSVRGENKSHTGKDHVAIGKITPRTGSDIPMPCVLPFTMELNYQLSSAPKGKLRVCLFLWRPGVKKSAKSGAKLSGLEPLCKSIEKDISKGSGNVVVTTDPVKIPKLNGNNYQIVVVSNIQSLAKKELCWATSYNFLRGNMAVRPGKGIGVRDSIQVLSFSPNVGDLYTGSDQAFMVDIRYNLKSKPWGFINLELAEHNLAANLGPWYCVTIPVQRGAGTVKVVTRKFFLPAAFAGKQLALKVPYRVQALGGTVDILQYGPWLLKRPQGGRR